MRTHARARECVCVCVRVCVCVCVACKREGEGDYFYPQIVLCQCTDFGLVFIAFHSFDGSGVPYFIVSLWHRS